MNPANNNMTPLFIRSIVKRGLKGIKEAPERNTRNLVDMALNFANGRFQKIFFEDAQRMLRNEHSAYYKLIQDIVLTVDEDRLLTFGMNVGYTSCTLGAVAIRRLEHEQKFNIPWSLTLITDLRQNPGLISRYRSILEQGKNLGIYTWLIFSSCCTRLLLPLIKSNPDCSFVLFCPPEEITDSLLTEADALHNLMFSVHYEKAATDACALLRQKRFLYSVHSSYQAEDAGFITSGGLLSCAEALHPVFTFFFPDSSCPADIQKLVYDYVLEARNAQHYHTFPLDLVYDNLYIDSIISSDSCTAGFDSNGNLFSKTYNDGKPEYNIFQNSLCDIFRRSFPKKEAEMMHS